MQEQNLGNGLWVKTHFHQEGPILHAVTYCVAAGTPELIRLSVDLRPIAKAVKKYHDRLHEEARRDPGLAAKAHIGAGVHVTAKLGMAKLRGQVSAAVRKVAARAIDHVPTRPDYLRPGEGLARGQQLHSPNGRARLIMQKDGNLVLYGDGAALTSTQTAGQPVTHAVMQPDGNLVLYGADGHAFWNSGTVGHPGAFLRLQDDANFVIYDHKTPIWNSGTWGFQPARKDKSWTEELADGAVKVYEVTKDVVRSKYTKWAVTAVSVVPGIGPGVMAAYTSANSTIDAIEEARAAGGAVGKAKDAIALVKDANEAVKKIGPAAAQASIAAHPALAARLRNAIATKNLARQLPPGAIAQAQTAGEVAMRKLAAIVQTAKSDPDPARRATALRALEVLKIVAEHRNHVKSIAQAHAGGLPGIRIDSQGRLIKGRWIRTAGHKDSYLHGPDGGQGSWARVDHEVPRPPQVHEATRAAQLAIAHKALAQKEPHKADQHRKAAAFHAKRAVALSRVAGATIGCPPVRSAPVRSAPVRSAPVRSAPVRSAPIGCVGEDLRSDIGRGGRGGGGGGGRGGGRGHRGGRGFRGGGGWWGPGYGPWYDYDDEVPLIIVPGVTA